MNKPLVTQTTIENKIYYIRGQKVMIDFDLAELYCVKTMVLNQAVKRNLTRFPSDFMFQLSKEEYGSLRSQNVTSNLISQNVISRWGGTRKLPFAFTDHGILMLSSILRSKRAILVNIAIMRAFIRLRRILSTHKALAQKLKELENRMGKHDDQIRSIFEAINELIALPDKTVKNIGFLKG